MVILLTQLQEEIEKGITDWNNRKRLDTDYEVKTKIDKDKNEINVYKVGDMGDFELTWNFVFGIAAEENHYRLRFFLDIAEDEILQSINTLDLPSQRIYMMDAFDFTLPTFTDVQAFLQEHVWAHDPGTMY